MSPDPKSNLGGVTKVMSPHPDFDLGGVTKRQFWAELWVSHTEILKIFRLAPSALAFVSYFGGRRAKKHAFVRASFWRTLKYCLRRPISVNENDPYVTILRSRRRRSRVPRLLYFSKISHTKKQIFPLAPAALAKECLL